jgi:hypothetical protein
MKPPNARMSRQQVAPADPLGRHVAHAQCLQNRQAFPEWAALPGPRSAERNVRGSHMDRYEEAVMHYLTANRATFVVH